MKRSIVLLLCTVLFLNSCRLFLYEYEYGTIRVKNLKGEVVSEYTEDNDIKAFIDFLNGLEWEDNVTKTGYDYIIYISDDQKLYYYSENGRMNDMPNKQSTILNDEAKKTFHRLLGIPVDEAVTE